MLDAMFHLPDQDAGGIYIVDEDVVSKKRPLFVSPLQRRESA
jgi:hypothetical protein